MRGQAAIKPWCPAKGQAGRQAGSTAGGGEKTYLEPSEKGEAEYRWVEMANVILGKNNLRQG